MNTYDKYFFSLSTENRRKVMDAKWAKFQSPRKSPTRHPHGTGLVIAFVASGMIVAGIVCIHAVWTGPVQDHISEQVEEDNARP